MNIRPAEVRYSAPTPWLWRYRWLLPVMGLGLAAVYAWQQHHWTPFFWTASLMLVAFLTAAVLQVGMGREFVADRERIRRPFRGGDIAWADVAYIVKPTQYDSVVRLRMQNGRLKTTGFPPEFAEQLAKIGNCEMRDGPSPWRQSH